MTPNKRLQELKELVHRLEAMPVQVAKVTVTLHDTLAELDRVAFERTEENMLLHSMIRLRLLYIKGVKPLARRGDRQPVKTASPAGKNKENA
jgi:hypothetical protein